MLWFASEFQVQIYNQYGQFVRKFGANILQHPRGVCVDNKGRIIVVECKVMRVIIFDQVSCRFNNIIITMICDYSQKLCEALRKPSSESNLFHKQGKTR